MNEWMNALSAHKNNFFRYPRGVYNSAWHPLKTLEVGGSDRNAQAVLMLSPKLTSLSSDMWDLLS